VLAVGAIVLATGARAASWLLPQPVIDIDTAHASASPWTNVAGK
jgi:hypothetical protein